MAYPTRPEPGVFGQPGRAQRLVNISGAAGSVALVVSLVWWGYELAVRDVSGVPVVRALEGPARMAPADPEGAVMDHQGLAVNDVAAEGAAAPTPDRLVLAPKPVELTLEDGPGLSTLPPATDADLQPARADSPVDLVPDLGAIIPEGTDPAVAAALAEALAEEPPPVVETASLDDSGLPPPEGAITRSPRPMPRPDGAGAGAPRTTSAPVAAAVPTEVDPETLAPGTRLVQFGAFDTPEEARAEWARLAGRFGHLLADKQLVLQPAESGGRTFWRLRAHGFGGEDDARRFCAALLTEGANCIPVAHR